MKKTIAILGGHGGMGQLLCAVFRDFGQHVIVADVETDFSNIEAVKEADVIAIAVPISSTLDVIKEIRKNKKDSRIVMLTGYGNIPTAVEAIKAGAIDYIPKPADADDVERALLAFPGSKATPPENPMSADRVKWEHIHRIFELCDRNVSETARRLKMHRRTLQRILSKRSPK